MDRTRPRIRHKHFLLDATKLSRVKKVLRADTETEAIELALDLVLSEHRRNQLAWHADELFPERGIDIKEVCGGLGTTIASRFKKTGLVTDLPELRGHKIKPATFGRVK